MPRSCAVLLLFALLVGTPARAEEGLGFQYTIERERGGRTSEGSFLRGFDVGEGLNLKIKLDQASFCYVLTSEAKGRSRLAFPAPGSRPADALSADQWARLPKSTFFLGDTPGVERIYLVVASQRVAELEQAAGSAGAGENEWLALDIRDRYQKEGSYRRDIEGGTVSVKYRPKGGAGAPSVVVEEISLRARR